MFKALHPQNWTWRHFVGTAAFLAAVNLFGPKGILHGLLVSQEAERLAVNEKDLRLKIAETREETRRFQHSPVAKERAIREELGYLKPDELSFEFNPRENPGGAPKEAAR